LGYWVDRTRGERSLKKPKNRSIEALGEEDFFEFVRHGRVGTRGIFGMGFFDFQEAGKGTYNRKRAPRIVTLRRSVAASACPSGANVIWEERGRIF